MTDAHVANLALNDDITTPISFPLSLAGSLEGTLLQRKPVAVLFHLRCPQEDLSLGILSSASWVASYFPALSYCRGEKDFFPKTAWGQFGGTGEVEAALGHSKEQWWHLPCQLSDIQR